jgi:hypothetical protein
MDKWKDVKIESSGIKQVVKYDNLDETGSHSSSK